MYKYIILIITIIIMILLCELVDKYINSQKQNKKLVLLAIPIISSMILSVILS